jgi:hypothetical protein
MPIYTTTGHWQSAPDCPELYEVEANSIEEAICQAEVEALNGRPFNLLDSFINDFVYEGRVNLVSSWAG